ncbi:MAG: restriction endonuclease subunit S, partial [Gemmatimonadaceae bacterium]
MHELGDPSVAALDRGVSWSKTDETSDGVAVLGIPQIRAGSIHFNGSIRLPRSLVTRKLLQSGDILLVGSSGAVKNVGRSALVRRLPTAEIAFASFVVRVRPAPQVNPEFLSLLLRSSLVDFEHHVKKAADGKYNLQLESLRRQKVLLPPLREQHAIACALGILERGIHLEEGLIACMRELKQAAMRQFFTWGLRGEAQKETDYGPLPSSWRTMSLGECCTVQSGVTKGRVIPREESLEVPYLRVANVQDGHLDLDEIKTIAIRRDELPRYLLRAGDVLLTEGGDFDK